jgi:ATP-dependent RNA helicase DeaD
LKAPEQLSSNFRCGISAGCIFMSFEELSLPWPLKQALTKMNFQTPTPIQAQAIPTVISGKDLIGCAQTGTGKTAAFGIPAVKHLIENSDGTVLVLVPTRELAEQVYGVFKQLTVCAPIKMACVIGGTGMRTQIMALRQGARVVVATPGRLIDHLGQGNVRLNNVSYLVLDEADRMLDMGFASQLERILKHLPKQRQTLLFSATLPPNILALGKKFLNDPVQVTVGNPNQAAPLIEQKVVLTEQPKKNDLLLDVINERKGSILVFAKTKSRTERINKYLESYGVDCDRIHGDRSQSQRQRAIDGLRKNQIRVLVATDIASRGIDVSHIEHVVNYDLPMDPEDYVHRIGRTGRNGKTGEALSFVTREDRAMWASIIRLLTKKDFKCAVPAFPGGGAGPDRREQTNDRRPRRGSFGPQGHQGQRSKPPHRDEGKRPNREWNKPNRSENSEERSASQENSPRSAFGKPQYKGQFRHPKPGAGGPSSPRRGGGSSGGGRPFGKGRTGGKSTQPSRSSHF